MMHQAYCTNPFVLLAVAQVVNKKVMITLTGEYTDPANSGKGDEIGTGFIGDGVFVAHVLKVRGIRF